MTPAGGVTSRYLLDNRHRAAADHHLALAELLDPDTTARLGGLGDWTGGRCLEVGAGYGSIALWLAGQVGEHGAVVAADLEPDHVPDHPRLRVVGVDLAADHWPDPLAGPFDLVHARLTLLHIPARRELLRRLAGLLAPDGVLLVEDWAPMREPMVMAAPTPEAAELYGTYQRVAAGVFDTAGSDPGWARRIHPAMLEDGLVDVETVIYGRYWTGGDPGCRLVAAAVAQLRPRLRAAGMPGTELDRLPELLSGPGLVLHGHPLYSTSGRRAR